MIWSELPWVEYLISGVAALILGVILSFILGKLLIRIKKKRIINNAYNKISNQNQKFVFNGKPYDLKAEMMKGEAGKEPEIEKAKQEIRTVPPIKRKILKMPDPPKINKKKVKK